MSDICSSSIHTLGDILDLLKKASTYDKYAYIKNGISLPEHPIVDSEYRYCFEMNTSNNSISNMIRDIEFVLSSIDNDYFYPIDIPFNEISPFIFKINLSEEKKNLLIEELCGIIEEGINKDYTDKFEP